MIRPMLPRAVAAAVFTSFALASGAAHAQDLAPPSTGSSSSSGSSSASGPSTGNGAAPAAAGANETPSSTLDAQEKKDSGRGLEWLYLNADAGFSYINMASLSTSKLGVQNESSQGPTFGVAAGVRLFILTLGARANLNTLSSFNFWQMDAEIGIHIPLGHFEPYFGIHGGYCFVGSLDDGVSGSNNVTINGGDAGLQLGLEYYFNHYVSLGIEGDGGLLFLHGSPSDVSAGSAKLTPKEKSLDGQSGDSVGVGIGGSLHVGFHL